MDAHYALADFLRSRRGRLRPEDVGLEPGGNRKVAGLRREELALLAGVSTDYYQRMEQGRDVRPSDDVLDALARALALSAAETRHLHRLARLARNPPEKPATHRPPEQVPESTRRLLRALQTPALVVGRHLDVLDWNPLAAALLADLDDPATERNALLALFRDPEARRRCPQWRDMALDYIGMLRAAVAADPDHPRAAALVGELSVHSADFRELWARHDVRETSHGTKTFLHPQIGEITLDWDTYPLPGSPGPVLVAYTAVPGSPDAERLALLATLRATRFAVTHR